MHPLALASTCLLLSSAGSTPANSVDDERLEELLPRIRAALDVSSDRPMLQVSGRCERFGLPHPFRWTFAPDGKFLRELKGSFSEIRGDDGEHTWGQDVRSPSFAIHGAERARLRAFAWVWSGAWCQPAGPFALTLRSAEESAGSIVLDYRMSPRSQDAQSISTAELTLTGELHIDPSTLYPSLLTYGPEHGGGSVHFLDWDESGSPAMPGLVRTERGLDQELTLQVQDSRVWERAAPQYANPHSPSSNAGFVDGASPTVATATWSGGNWIVRPKLDGKVRGAFVLDPASSHSSMTQAVAESLGYRAFGSLSARESGLASANGPRAGWYQGRYLELGPFVIEGLRYHHVESPVPSVVLGDEETVGVLGWDVFVRCTVVLDADHAQLELHDPQTFQSTAELAASIRWMDMQLIGRVPHLALQVDGEPDRWMRYDPNLLGPEVWADIEFEDDAKATLGGNKVVVERSHAATSNNQHGTPWVLGKFGRGALPPGALVFDYRNSRLGILPAE